MVRTSQTALDALAEVGRHPCERRVRFFLPISQSCCSSRLQAGTCLRSRCHLQRRPAAWIRPSRVLKARGGDESEKQLPRSRIFASSLATSQMFPYERYRDRLFSFSQCPRQSPQPLARSRSRVRQCRRLTPRGTDRGLHPSLLRRRSTRVFCPFRRLFQTNCRDFARRVRCARATRRIKEVRPQMRVELACASFESPI